jgi:catechol 2,3-dioxygenase-like lactoylglutathione lyase family enzyme
MDHVGVIVDDLDGAIAFVAELGLEEAGRGRVDGEWVDRIVGLDGVQNEFAFVKTPDGHGRLELIQFHTPPAEGGGEPLPANTIGLRHLAFVVDDIDASVAALQGHGGELVGTVENYQDIFRLCYIRGPAGIIVELAQALR